MNQKEWYDQSIKKGTRGDMVFDILRDWEKEHTRIIERLEREKRPITDMNWNQGENTGLDLAIRIVKEEMGGGK